MSDSCALGRQREDHRLGDDLRQVARGNSLQRLFALVGRQQIHLAEDEDQLVLRAPQDPLLQERALRLLEHLRAVEQEQHRVGARDVAVGDLGALLVDVVDARRVDERDVVLQDLRRPADLDVRDVRRLAARDGDPVAELLRVDLLGRCRR